MKKNDYVINDKVIIPKYIRNMSDSQLENEIAKLEKEILEKKMYETFSIPKAL